MPRLAGIKSTMVSTPKSTFVQLFAYSSPSQVGHGNEN